MINNHLLSICSFPIVYNNKDYICIHGVNFSQLSKLLMRSAFSRVPNFSNLLQKGTSIAIICKVHFLKLLQINQENKHQRT